MKKLFFGIALILGGSASAQMLEVGIVDQISSTWIFNENVSAAGAEGDYAPAFGNTIGLRAGYYFTENFGVESGVMFGAHNQKYTGTYKSNLLLSAEAYEAEVNLKTTNIPILLKFGSKSYIELGAMYSSIGKATYSRTGNDPVSGVDVSSAFGGSSLAAVLGFGGNIDVSDELKIAIGLRLGYGLSDIVGVDWQGRDLTKVDPTILGEVYGTDPHLIPDLYQYAEYKASNMVFGGLNIGLTYRIGG